MKQYKLKDQTDEWELPPPAETPAVSEMKSFFASPDPDKEVDKLAYKELCEELLKEYLAVKEKLEGLQAIQKHLRNDLIKLSGGTPGAYQKGQHTLVIKNRQGSVKVNFDKFVEDEWPQEYEKLMAMKDLVRQGKSTTGPYIEQGESGLIIEVV